MEQTRDQQGPSGQSVAGFDCPSSSGTESTSKTNLILDGLPVQKLGDERLKVQQPTENHAGKHGRIHSGPKIIRDLLAERENRSRNTDVGQLSDCSRGSGLQGENPSSDGATDGNQTPLGQGCDQDDRLSGLTLTSAKSLVDVVEKAIVGGLEWCLSEPPLNSSITPDTTKKVSDFVKTTATAKLISPVRSSATAGPSVSPSPSGSSRRDISPRSAMAPSKLTTPGRARLETLSGEEAAESLPLVPATALFTSDRSKEDVSSSQRVLSPTGTAEKSALSNISPGGIADRSLASSTTEVINPSHSFSSDESSMDTVGEMESPDRAWDYWKSNGVGRTELGGGSGIFVDSEILDDLIETDGPSSVEEETFLDEASLEFFVELIRHLLGGDEGIRETRQPGKGVVSLLGRPICDKVIDYCATLFGRPIPGKRERADYIGKSAAMRQAAVRNFLQEPVAIKQEPVSWLDLGSPNFAFSEDPQVFSALLDDLHRGLPEKPHAGKKRVRFDLPDDDDDDPVNNILQNRSASPPPGPPLYPEVEDFIEAALAHNPYVDRATFLDLVNNHALQDESDQIVSHLCALRGFGGQYFAHKKRDGDNVTLRVVLTDTEAGSDSGGFRFVFMKEMLRDFYRCLGPAKFQCNTVHCCEQLKDEYEMQLHVAVCAMPLDFLGDSGEDGLAVEEDMESGEDEADLGGQEAVMEGVEEWHEEKPSVDMIDANAAFGFFQDTMYPIQKKLKSKRKYAGAGPPTVLWSALSADQKADWRLAEKAQLQMQHLQPLIDEVLELRFVPLKKRKRASVDSDEDDDIDWKEQMDHDDIETDQEDRGDSESADQSEDEERESSAGNSAGSHPVNPTSGKRKPSEMDDPIPASSSKRRFMMAPAV